MQHSVPLILSTTFTQILSTTLSLCLVLSTTLSLCDLSEFPTNPSGPWRHLYRVFALAQQQVAFQWNQQRIGTEEEILVDGYAETEGGTRLYGRSYAEAPEIASRVYLPTGCAEPGQYVRTRITGMEDYDLTATPL